MNWEEACSTLGVPTSATRDEIHTRYIYKVQLLHPDKNVGLPDRARKQAEEELKLVNVAYSVLKDERNNTSAIAPKLRVSPKTIRFKSMAPGQSKSTRVRIESVGGAYTKFWMGEPSEDWLRIVEVKSVSNDPFPLDVTIEATAAGGANKRRGFSLPIRLENERNKTKDETTLDIVMIESKSVVASDELSSTTSPRRHFSLSGRARTLALLLVPGAVGLAIFAYLKSLIPFWSLASFSVTFTIEKWFRSPIHKYHPLGMVYRILLNVGLLSYLAFGIWSATKLFSGHFMSSPLRGSLVFMGECALFIWLGTIVGRNSWRRPSMKLTVASLTAAFLILAFAGVEPVATYKNNMIDPFTHPAAGQTQPMPAQTLAAAKSPSSGAMPPAVEAPIPSYELTEGNLTDWSAGTDDQTGASDGKPTSVGVDYSFFKVGNSSIRLQTESGSDVYLQYRVSQGQFWDLSGRSNIHFWVYTEDPSPTGFQWHSPRIQLHTSGGDYMQYQANTDILNDSRGSWQEYDIPLDGDATWNLTTVGAASLSRITAIEIHADTWDYGFTMWVDGLTIN